MTGIFLSYRRADSQGWAGRLGADLAAEFGDVSRFFDIESIPPGADFLREIERSLAKVGVVMVLIGPRWLDLRDSKGQRRLDDPADIVAAEIAQALTLNVPVIPVLLGSAPMPAAEDLPVRLKQLHRLNGFELSDSRWKFDIERLFTTIEDLTGLKRRVPPGPLPSVSVGSYLDLREATVGQVTGVRGAAPAANVDVLKAARLQNVKIGDITGVQITTQGELKP